MFLPQQSFYIRWMCSSYQGTTLFNFHRKTDVITKCSNGEKIFGSTLFLATEVLYTSTPPPLLRLQPTSRCSMVMSFAWWSQQRAAKMFIHSYSAARCSFRLHWFAVCWKWLVKMPEVSCQTSRRSSEQTQNLIRDWMIHLDWVQTILDRQQNKEGLGNIFVKNAEISKSKALSELWKLLKCVLTWDLFRTSQ